MKFAKRKAPGEGEFAAYEFDLQRSLEFLLIWEMARVILLS